MRVISGSAGGLRLKSVEGMSTRPTSDRIKESLFNIISQNIYGSRVLDLFAGTGALGIEALSRGAESSVFVDNSKASIDRIRDNLKSTHLETNTEIIKAEYNFAIEKFSRINIKFDYIFVDPPYGKNLGVLAVEMISHKMVLSTHGFIVVESDIKDNMPEKIGQFFCFDRREYGRTVMSFFRLGDLV